MVRITGSAQNGARLSIDVRAESEDAVAATTKRVVDGLLDAGVSILSIEPARLAGFVLPAGVR